mmetsp:Transcript_12275/g.29830  ORF Transcript_12275/g.29830 Transcript_12275/m.29830 type:complete len:101 (-) Transcript_12275:206-508(-)
MGCLPPRIDPSIFIMSSEDGIILLQGKLLHMKHRYDSFSSFLLASTSSSASVLASTTITGKSNKSTFQLSSVGAIPFLHLAPILIKHVKDRIALDAKGGR